MPRLLGAVVAIFVVPGVAGAQFFIGTTFSVALALLTGALAGMLISGQPAQLAWLMKTVRNLLTLKDRKQST